MSRSDRRERTAPLDGQSHWFSLSLALNLCAAVFIAILILLPSPFGRDLIHEDGKTYYEHYEAGCREAESARTSILSGLEKPATSGQRAEQHKQKATNEADIARECDMAAQYLAAESAASMDRSGWVTMITTVIAAILIAFTLFFTAKTLNEAKEATNQARLATDAAMGGQRARLIARYELDAKKIIPSQIRTHVRINGGILQIENIGKNFATRVSVEVISEAVSGKDWNIYSQFERIFKISSQKPEAAKGNNTIFPSEKWIDQSNSSIGFEASEFFDAMNTSVAAESALYVIFRVFYCDGEDTKNRFQTTVAYNISVSGGIKFPQQALTRDVSEIESVRAISMVGCRYVS